VRRLAWICALFAGCASNSGDAPLAGPYTDASLPDVAVGGADGGAPIFITGSSGTGQGSSTGFTSVSVVSSTSGVAPSSGTGTSTGTGSSTATMTGGSSSIATTTTHTASSSMSHAPVPTWVYLYNTYLAETGTLGTCDGGSCHHHSECDNPLDCYDWIVAPGKYTFTAGSDNPIFTWDDGFMPKDGPTSEPQADADFGAWVAAGSLNDG
jgi:hypothetical protein